jgi:restriction system protein
VAWEAATEHLGGPGDQGLDGLIRQDLLGLDVVYVQAKRYATDRKIGRPDIQGFVGALHGAQASRASSLLRAASVPTLGSMQNESTPALCLLTDPSWPR